MSIELPHVGKVQQTSAPAASAGPAGDPAGVERLSPPVDVQLSIPASPPEQLRDEMAAAAQRVDQLRDQGRELHFERDHETGRVVVQVLDLNGNVLRTIPPSQMLDVLAGAPLEVD